ncbi:hypothetical protein SAMN05216252_11668 [Actinacidiphila glaucinigra]|uniref:Transposase n=1 Tax=Actinacidiphila glaucinigra TaxID=235986 RepID=A0A239KP67_9ACTN|nr:hypothetical protein SAMN05216252_11668 [Actinacidiphila glaucinigra]
MTTELNTLVTTLYVKIDDEWAGIARLPGRPPKLSHSESLCLAVRQALLGFHSEARWLRHLRAHHRHLFPYIPQDSGYNKRLRAALPQVKRVIRTLARDTDFWHDTVRVADSTPVPCGMSRPTVSRSKLAGWANYGYCASHSRFFWGLRLNDGKASPRCPTPSPAPVGPSTTDGLGTVVHGALFVSVSGIFRALFLRLAKGRTPPWSSLNSSIRSCSASPASSSVVGRQATSSASESTSCQM